MPATKQPDKSVILTKEQELQEWRRAGFIEMGFLPHQATALSKAKDPATGFPVDKYKVIRAIDSGCTKAQAFEIFT